MKPDKEAAPEWVSVPRLITQEMLDATCATDADDEEMRLTWLALIAAAPKPPTNTGERIAALEAWNDIAEAPKDGTVIWAAFHPRLYPDVRPGREDLERWNGVQVPLRHPGIVTYDDGPFDMGWNVAAPVGTGGFPDDWIVGWRRMPEPPARTALAGEQG